MVDRGVIAGLRSRVVIATRQISSSTARTTVPIVPKYGTVAPHQAITELKALPEDARERRIALPILVRCRLEVPEDPTQRTVDDEEFLMSTQDILEVWERKVKQEGRMEGVQRSLIAAYKTRFGAIPKDLRAAIEGTHAEATLDGWLKVIVARSADEIRAALLHR
jgi:hypothetical protein